MLAHEYQTVLPRPSDRFSAMGHPLTADTDVSDAEFRLIAAIKRYDWRDGVCRASQAVLGVDCGKDERTVRRLVLELKRKDLLVEENDPRRPGRSRVYRLIGAATTHPQTGQLWPVYDRDAGTQTGQKRPVKADDPGQLKRPNPAGLKKTPEDRLTPDTAATQPGAVDDPIVVCAPPTQAPQPAPAPKPLLPVPKPRARPDPVTNRLACVIDRIRAAGLNVAVSGRDGAALKDCTAAPEEIANCYIAIARGEYGDAYMRRRLAIHYVATDAVNGWLVRDQAPTTPTSPRPIPGRDVNAARTGYSGSRNGPIDPTIAEIFERTMET
jgi:hypothetical protein